MTDTAPDDWSPADVPAAIAVSESYWWLSTVKLTILRLRDEDDRRVAISSRQIDARQLLFALRQLLTAAELLHVALKAMGVDQAVGAALSEAEQRFVKALPDITHMRNALMHFENWSRGEGRGPQRDRLKAGGSPRDVARTDWTFAYDPRTDTAALGDYVINVATADRAAAELARVIYQTAREAEKAPGRS
jgi:hypothetical protein